MSILRRSPDDEHLVAVIPLVAQLETISRKVCVRPMALGAGRWGQAEHSAAAIRSSTKRLIDVFGALLGLVLLWPVLLVVAILVRLTSPGPVLFRQLRQGQGERPFWFLKFRTMTADAEHRLCDLEPLNEAAGEGVVQDAA